MVDQSGFSGCDDNVNKEEMSRCSLLGKCASNYSEQLHVNSDTDEESDGEEGDDDGNIDLVMTSRKTERKIQKRSHRAHHFLTSLFVGVLIIVALISLESGIVFNLPSWTKSCGFLPLTTAEVAPMASASLPPRARSRSRLEDEGSLKQYEDASALTNPFAHQGQLGEDFYEDDEVQTSKKNKEEVIVVAAIDGTIAGLSRSTGQTLWKRIGEGNKDEANPLRNDGGQSQEHETDEKLFSPLVSTTTTTRSGGAAGQEWRTAAVPSADGRVFLTLNSEATPSSSQEQSSTTSSDLTVTATVRDLVSQAPFVDARGRIYVGSRLATAAALDRDTGEVLRLVTGDKAAFPQKQRKKMDKETMNDSDAKNDHDSEVLQDRDVVWVGRVDYTVSVHDASSGEMDVQFSSSEVLSVDDMVRGRQDAAFSQNGMLGFQTPLPMLPPGEGGEAPQADQREPTSGKFEPQPPPPLLVATPNGNLALRDPDREEFVWVASETFDTPIAFAVESESGKSIGVDVIPDAAVPSSSKEYLMSEFKRQLAALDGEAENAIQETHDYGVPESTFDGTTSETIVGALKNGQLFALPLGKDKNIGTRKRPPSIRLPAEDASLKHTTEISPVTGRPHNEFSTHQKRHGYGDELHKTVTTIGRKFCFSNSPGCTGPKLNGLGSVYGSIGQLFDRTRPNGNSDFDPVLGEDADDAVEAEGPGRTDRDQTFGSFWSLVSSWIPPAMALAFVVSFELSRRERMRVEGALLDSRHVSRSNTNTSESSSNVSKPNHATEPAMPALIQVSDEVLGYGGHGTVVYKGKLDGRNVAVKRMLKAYHASADREISLLIESDGHPNVVRYFLKELRGDFVYLALELCDMSLQDLIVSLCKHRRTDMRTPPLQATKSALLQIASGVRHLHSLRIVHRDLKPQNILLAYKRRTNASKREELSTSNNGEASDYIYTSFLKSEYVPKISDMGLGKQIIGQSSFGLSTFGKSSAGAAPSSFADGSTVAGPGPGSVGWQAPEVMAQRKSPESTAFSPQALQHSGEDSFGETSPVGIVPSTRISRSVDVFSLGCVFYCTLVPGSHPFGEWYEREANIMKNKPSTEELEKVSVDGADLVNSMINRDPKARPSASQICHHPFFWNSDKRLSFLCDLSDRLEIESYESDEKGESDERRGFDDPFMIERSAVKVVGRAWDQELDPALINNVARFRSYDPSSVRDCLRMIRNKHHHFDELPLDFKQRINFKAEGLMEYFESVFPRLLMHCYNVCRDKLNADDPLAVKYGILPVNRVVVKSNGKFVPANNSLGEKKVNGNAGKEPENCVGKESEKGVDSSFVSECEEATGNETLQKYKKGDVDPSTMVTTKVSDTPEIEADSSAVQENIPNGTPALEIGSNENSADIIIWEGSNAAKSYRCRGWMRSDTEWTRRIGSTVRKRDSNLNRCADDPKYRTRLCNHWDISLGTQCPMRKKNKCVFAHGPVELRVKEGKKNRWGRLVDANGNNSNPFHSGGEDTYGAARSVESMRKEEGKWNTDNNNNSSQNKSRQRNRNGKKK